MKTTLKRGIRKIGRQLPPELKKTARAFVQEHQSNPLVVKSGLAALVSGSARSASKRVATGKGGAQLGIDPAMIGSTYEAEDVLGMLALENQVLKQRLDESLAALDAVSHLVEDTTVTDAPAEEDAEAEPQATPAELTEDYLSGRPAGAQGTRHLIVANEYPDVGREYGNGFVHRRVKLYQEAGVDVDVVILGPSLERRIYEYDGVRILSGNGPELGEILDRVDYHSVSVHFLNKLMWQWLEPRMERLAVYVFLHGYECDRWIRRIFNFTNGTALERAIDRTLQLQRFWASVLANPHQPRKYIFVSDWWRRAVTDDMQVVFPAWRTAIIHNIIDTELFNYVPKAPEQRFKLLWVRSASNRKYGNDIAIDILKRLKRTEFWPKTSVTIVGDGEFFGEFEDEFGSDANVTIRREFVSQEQVAQLHKEHGILLVPSRLDSQGVSRDEAMSSGLVPVTNLVTAIPEFVDENSGIVAPAEDAATLAEGIVALMRDPKRFQQMSEAASQRASSQCGASATVMKELSTMGLLEPTAQEERA